VVSKGRERLAVSKQRAQKLVGERFNLRRVNKLQVSKQYHIKISNMFAALEKLSDGENTNRAWENVQLNIKSSAIKRPGVHELKQHKPWYHEECLVSYITGSRLKSSGYRILTKEIWII